MDIDLTNPQYGRCENCEFRCVLLHVANFVSKAAMDALSADPQGEITAKTVYICPTCFVTPRGILSPNLSHKRYPQAEYEKDKWK